MTPLGQLQETQSLSSKSLKRKVINLFSSDDEEEENKPSFSLFNEAEKDFPTPSLKKKLPKVINLFASDDEEGEESSQLSMVPSLNSSIPSNGSSTVKPTRISPLSLLKSPLQSIPFAPIQPGPKLDLNYDMPSKRDAKSPSTSDSSQIHNPQSQLLATPNVNPNSFPISSTSLQSLVSPTIQKSPQLQIEIPPKLDSNNDKNMIGKCLLNFMYINTVHVLNIYFTPHQYNELLDKLTQCEQLLIASEQNHKDQFTLKLLQNIIVRLLSNVNRVPQLAKGTLPSKVDVSYNGKLEFLKCFFKISFEKQYSLAIIASQAPVMDSCSQIASEIGYKSQCKSIPGLPFLSQALTLYHESFPLGIKLVFLFNIMMSSKDDLKVVRLLRTIYPNATIYCLSIKDSVEDHYFELLKVMGIGSSTTTEALGSFLGVQGMHDFVADLLKGIKKDADFCHDEHKRTHYYVELAKLLTGYPPPTPDSIHKLESAIFTLPLENIPFASSSGCLLSQEIPFLDQDSISIDGYKIHFSNSELVDIIQKSSLLTDTWKKELISFIQDHNADCPRLATKKTIFIELVPVVVDNEGGMVCLIINYEQQLREVVLVPRQCIEHRRVLEQQKWGHHGPFFYCSWVDCRAFFSSREILRQHVLGHLPSKSECEK